ncbi:hypothetical protein [Brevibacillus borstelensis]|uniref:hypothetical protein n=1 Tax=Brevibacillus borstelensis TaxID=45462 RepID=UPI0030C2E552
MEKTVRAKAQETFVKVCDEVQRMITNRGLIDEENLQSAARLIEVLSMTGMLYDGEPRLDIDEAYRTLRLFKTRGEGVE